MNPKHLTPPPDNAPFIVFVTTYDRSAKAWTVRAERSSHVAFHGVCTDNCPSGVYRALGMVIAGILGPRKPPQRAALVRGMLAYLRSDQQIDDHSFSVPYLPL